jgi:CheY-like chemotaxis protein
MNHTVLYIEDSQDNVALMTRLFSRRPNARLVVAENARDGIEAAVREQPALILLDNHLPDGTGSDVMRELASAQATAFTPVIVISGDAGQALADGLLALGAAEIVPKPFEIRELLAAIDRYLPDD